MKHDGWSPNAFGLDEGQVRGLEIFGSLLVERAIPLGMLAAGDAGRLWDRHIVDSLRAVSAVRVEDGDAYDIGSGAGLPGVVIALARPGVRMTLVEPRRNRAAFLELAIERLELGNARVHVGPIAEITEPVDICFARAFSDARGSWAAANRLLRPGGVLAYFAGEAFDEARDVPSGVSASIVEETSLASSGALVIMARQ